MTDNSIKTIHGGLVKEGFVVRSIIKNSSLPEGLSKILLENARGNFADMRILPGDIALKGADWILENSSSHIVYVKPNNTCEGGYFVSVCLRHKETGELSYMVL